VTAPAVPPPPIAGPASPDAALQWAVNAVRVTGGRVALQDERFEPKTLAVALDGIGGRPAFGTNLDPSDLLHQPLDTAQFALEFADRIYHVHVKDSKLRRDGRRSILGSHLNIGEEARGWDFVSPGHGDGDF